MKAELNGRREMTNAQLKGWLLAFQMVSQNHSCYDNRGLVFKGIYFILLLSSK